MNVCPVCNRFRSLKDHLFELSEICRYLGNVRQYARGKDKCEVSTLAISDWLKLASHLKLVKVGWWRVSSVLDNGFCASDFDDEASDDEHFSNFATALTRYIYVTNALEETYRFIFSEYIALAYREGIPKKEQVREPSMMAAEIVRRIESGRLPDYLNHAVKNVELTLLKYIDHFSLTANQLSKLDSSSQDYGLGLLRYIRNHVAHGRFPILENPNLYGKSLERRNVFNMLHHSTRLSAMFIQTILLNFNDGFKSVDYMYMEQVWDEEGTYYVDNCQIDLLSTVHLHGEFSFAKPVKSLVG
jgi:hypothetical protein